MSYKINLNLGWFAWLLPVVMFLIFGVPQLQQMWKAHLKTQSTYANYENELNSLKLIEKPSKAEEIRIEVLEKITVQQKKASRSQNKTIYQTIGLVMLLLLMFAVFGYDSWKLKNNKWQNYTIQQGGHFNDYSFDAVAQKISWSPINSGGSNFVTHKLKTVNSNKITIKKTGTLNIIGLTFLLIGLNYIFFEFLFVYQNN